MKWLPVILSVLLAFPAMAADDQGKTALKPLSKDTGANPKIVIVNGKKFYSLAGARRFTGGANNPGALMVIHHPRSPETIITHRSTLAAAPAGSGSPAASPATPASTGQPGDILSVFAPDDKTAPVPPPIK